MLNKNINSICLVGQECIVTDIKQETNHRVFGKLQVGFRFIIAECIWTNEKMKKDKFDYVFKILIFDEKGNEIDEEVINFDDLKELTKFSYEETYVRTEDKMDFGEAIRKLKAGNKVRRKNWHPNKKFVYYISENKIARKIVEKSEKKYNPYLVMRNYGGTVSEYSPSVDDCLAEDWEVVKILK